MSNTSTVSEYLTSRVVGESRQQAHDVYKTRVGIHQSFFHWLMEGKEHSLKSKLYHYTDKIYDTKEKRFLNKNEWPKERLLDELDDKRESFSHKFDINVWSYNDNLKMRYSEKVYTSKTQFEKDNRVTLTYLVAEIKVERHEFEGDDGFRVLLDMIEFPDGDSHLVCSIQRPEKAPILFSKQLDEHKFSPVRSAAVEYFYRYDSKLYNDLWQKRYVPDIEYQTCHFESKDTEERVAGHQELIEWSEPDEFMTEEDWSDICVSAQQTVDQARTPYTYVWSK